MVNRLKTDIGYLASDELAGRRTGTDGEAKAGDYIEKRYKELGIPAYKGNYRHTFHFVYGKEITPGNRVVINNNALKVDGDAFPLPFSGTGHVSTSVMGEIKERGNVWVMRLYKDKDQSNDPHFEAEKQMYEAAKAAEKSGATGVLFYDQFGSKYEPTFNKQSEFDALGIPVVFVKHKGIVANVSAAESEKGDANFSLDISTNIKKTDRTGTNIAAYLDNGAKYTVVLGAHYDHLGFGEDGNSLYANAQKEHEIHHGADDNASGTAALMEMAKWAKGSKLHNYNYLFVHFSGEELGLFGSKAFVKDENLDSNTLAYMLNMDMVGRLNDSTHALTLGGVGTSPVWGEMVELGGKQFKMVLDSAGVGPSDHTSFYRAGVPVLFLFTGTHKDYHKPSDRAEFINYKGEADVIGYAENIVTKMEGKGQKPAYTVTKTNSSGRTRFKVTLGIMPDYTYQEGGVRVDGVTDGKAAAKAGVKAGDIIVQLGQEKIQSMQSYMEALGKFQPGDVTQVKLKRDGKEMSLPIEFMAK